MAEINNSWSIGSVAPVSGVHDYATSYINVGNELNKQYWQNRQLYMEGVVQPLAQVEADEFGQEELNRIKGEIESRASEFEESGMWHRAGDFIFNEAKNIATNQTLKEIIKSKSLYDAFVKTVNESNWSSADKAGFMLRAHHTSSKITTDENGMVSGGFNPISVGESFDMGKYSLDVMLKLEKVKADKVNVAQMINDPKQLEAYGLPSVVDNEGRTLISHIVEQTTKTETVSAEDLARAAQQIVALNPEVQKQILEEQTNAFYRKYYDKSTGTFKDIPREELNKSLFPEFYGTNKYNEANTYIETIIGLDSSKFLVEDKATGSYTYKPGQIFDYNKKNEDCITKFGISLDDLYTKGLDDRVLQRVIDIATANELNRLNLNLTDPTSKELINELIISKNINSAWKDYVENITGTAISLYAYNHIEQSNKFIDNPAYKAYLNNYYKYSLKPSSGGYDPTKPSSVDENGMIDYTNFLSSNLEQINSLSNEKNKILAQDNSILKDLTAVDNPLLEKLGFVANGKIDKDLLQSADLSKLDEIATKEKYYNTDNYQAIRNSIIQLRSNKEQIDEISKVQESYKFNAQTLYDYYNESAKEAKETDSKNYYHGFGWYGIASDIAKFIANNNITSVEEFKEAVNNSTVISSHVPGTPYGTQSSYLLKDPKGNTYINNRGYSYMKGVSDEEIQKEISNVLDNIQHRYEKKSGKPFEWVQQSYSITNPNYTLQTRLEGRKAAWQGGSGSLQTLSLADGSAGGSVLPSDVAALIGLNQFPVSVTVNEKGEKITERNIATKESTPIPAKTFKTKKDIYKTEIRYNLNPIEQARGYIVYDIICKDKSGAYCGTVKVREQTSDVNEYLLDVYEQFKPLADNKNASGLKAIGVICNNIGESAYTFKGTEAQPAEGLTELKNNVENMYKRGNNGYTYTLETKQIYSEASVIDPIKIKITKVNDGYIIDDLSTSNVADKGKILIPKQYQSTLGLTGCDTGWNGQRVFATLDLAFYEYSKFNAELSSILRRIDHNRKQ